MEMVPGHNKRTSQYAAQDSARTTHTAVDDEKNRATKDANRKPQPVVGHSAEKDANRSKTMPTPKKFFNKALHEKCMAKGMSKEDADDLAGTPPGDDEDVEKGGIPGGGEDHGASPEGKEGDHSEPDGDESEKEMNAAVKKAFDDLADIVKSGQNLFTQEQVDALGAQYKDRVILMAKSIEAFTTLTQSRFGVIEKAILAHHDQTELLFKALNDANDLNKAMKAELDDLRKAKTVTPEADPMTKAEPVAGAAVEAAQAVTIIESPNEEHPETTPKGPVTPATFIERAKDRLSKGGLPKDEERMLKACLADATMGLTVTDLQAQYGKVLGDL